jgi:hypothetical protein
LQQVPQTDDRRHLVARARQAERVARAYSADGRPNPLRDHHSELVQLRDVMEGFENFLGGVDGALDAALSEGLW